MVPYDAFVLGPKCSPTLLQSGGEDRARCPVTSALLELRGGHVAEGTVGTDGIVVHAPGLDDLTRVRQAAEPVLVQALVTESAVETLDVGILIRLAGFDEVQPDAVGVGPCIQRSADELGSIVRDQDCRCPPRLDEALEDLDDPPPAELIAARWQSSFLLKSSRAQSVGCGPS